MWWVTFLGAVTIAMLIATWRRIRGTTLVGPWCWLILALAALTITEASSLGSREPESPSIRLLVGTLTLCPGIALVGAKRPQDKPWHFIVASLWVVLSLPAIQTLVMGKAGELDIHTGRSWFLLILGLFTIGNTVFTGQWLGVLVGGIGQALILSPFLPGISDDLPWSKSLGLACYALGTILNILRDGWKRSRPKSLNRLWSDFRDSFGLVWTVRLAERINATARANGWEVNADWRIHTSSETNSPERDPGAELQETPSFEPIEKSRAFRQNLSNLLRRFVSEEWIAQRWE